MCLPDLHIYNFKGHLIEIRVFFNAIQLYLHRERFLSLFPNFFVINKCDVAAELLNREILCEN